MKNIFLIFISFLLLFSSCKRTVKEGIVGPEIKAASANFQVLDTLKANYSDGDVRIDSATGVVTKRLANDTISFQVVESLTKPGTSPSGKPIIKEIKSNNYGRKTFWKVKFNEEVSWNLTLTKFVDGEKDNSVQKTISGTSSFLDSSNTAWKGNGNSTMFAAGDHILVELSFVNGSLLVIKDTLFIAKEPFFEKTKASLVIDFETDLDSKSAYPYTDNKDKIVTPIAPKFGIDGSINTPQGANSFILYGRDYNGDYFCGGLNIQKLDTETMKNYNPRDIYLNMYIYGYPADNALEISSKATKLNIGFSEKDNPLNTGDAFDALTEDTFEKQISVDWVGWKLISVRYADLVPSGSKTSGGSGNGRFEPGKVFSVNCNLISSPNGSTVGANIDYVIITYGQPFDANNL
jgi:hypothetical protein